MFLLDDGWRLPIAIVQSQVPALMSRMLQTMHALTPTSREGRVGEWARRSTSFS